MGDRQLILFVGIAVLLIIRYGLVLVLLMLGKWSKKEKRKGFGSNG